MSRRKNPSRAAWIGGVAVAALALGAGIAFASSGSGGAQPSSSGPLILVNGILPLQTLSPNGAPLVVFASPLLAGMGLPTTITSARTTVIPGTPVPVSLTSSPSAITIAPNGQTNSLAIIEVGFTDASGTDNICTIIVTVGTLPPTPPTLVDGALMLSMTRTQASLVIPAPAGALVSNVVVDSVSYGTHVPIEPGAYPLVDPTGVVLAPTGNGPSVETIKATYSVSGAVSVCTIVVVVP